MDRLEELLDGDQSTLSTAAEIIEAFDRAKNECEDSSSLKLDVAKRIGSIAFKSLSLLENTEESHEVYREKLSDLRAKLNAAGLPIPTLLDSCSKDSEKFSRAIADPVPDEVTEQHVVDANQSDQVNFN